MIGGVRCVAVEPAGGGSGGVLLYLHGGGYRLGSPLAYLDYAASLAEATGWRVVMPFYRLAPEHPFPAALHDAVAVYRALADGRPIVIAGDSAGGGLTAALCQAAAAAGAPAGGAILVSPMLDLTAQGASYDRNAVRDVLFSRQAVLEAADMYLQGHPADDPLVSPLNADPAVFPPTLLLVGTAEVLLDEVLVFAGSLARADMRVSLHIAPAVGHVWPLIVPGSDAAAEAFGAIGAFVKGLESSPARPSA